MKSAERKKRKARDRDKGIENVDDDGSSDGRRKRQCRNGFIRYFGEVVRQIKAKDGMASITREIRREIGSTYKNLPPEEKCQYKSECEQVGKLNMAKPKFLTRCAPDRLAAVISQFTEEQRHAVYEMGFGSLVQLNCGRLKRKLCGWLVEKIDIGRCILELNGIEVELSPKSFSYIMGISDGGNPLQLEGEMSEVSLYLEKFNATSRGINITVLAEILRNSKSADDLFKDVHNIRKRNWATFCFQRLFQGITRYKEEKLVYIGGCLLYLEMLYFNSIIYGKLQRDRSMCPLALWNGYEIKKLMKWIDKKGGFESDQVAICSMGRESPSISSARQCEIGKGKVINGDTGNGTIVSENVSQLVNYVGELVRLSSQLAGHVDKLKAVGPRSSEGGVEIMLDGPRDEVRGEVDGHSPKRHNDGIINSMGDAAVTELRYSCAGANTHEDIFSTDGSYKTAGHAASEMGSGLREECNRGGPNSEQLDLCGKSLSAVVQCNHEHVGYRAGPYIMPTPVSTNEAQLIEYTMSFMLDKGELLVKSKYNSITRNEILSLSPRSTITFEIVSAVAEILTEHEMRFGGRKRSSWFIPSFFSQQVHGDETESPSILPSCKLCNIYMKDLSYCEKIFVPVNHGNAYWYVLVVIMTELRAEIWDPLRSSLTAKKLILEAQCVLRALDLVFRADTTNAGTIRLKFEDFQVQHCKSAIMEVPQPFDCALYCLLLMENHKRYMQHPL